MRTKSGAALMTLSLVLGAGLGAAAGGCGEDRDGSVEVEGGTTGAMGTTGTVETTGTTGTTTTP